MKIKEFKEFIRDMDDDSELVVEYGCGHVNPSSLEVYHQTIPRLGCKKTDSVIINLDGGLFDVRRRLQEHAESGYVLR